MSERIDQFCDKLRVRLTDVDDRINTLKAGLDSASVSAKDDIRSQLDKAKAEFEPRKHEVEQVRSRLETMLEQKKDQTKVAVDQWIRERQVEELEARAQLTEDYAAEKVWLATVAVEEAELATLEALAARIESDEVNAD